jgi:hypothetical protein
LGLIKDNGGRGGRRQRKFVPLSENADPFKYEQKENLEHVKIQLTYLSQIPFLQSLDREVSL